MYMYQLTCEQILGYLQDYHCTVVAILFLSNVTGCHASFNTMPIAMHDSVNSNELLMRMPSPQKIHI